MDVVLADVGGVVAAAVVSSRGSALVLGRGVCFLKAAAALCVGLISTFTPPLGIAFGTPSTTP